MKYFYKESIKYLGSFWRNRIKSLLANLLDMSILVFSLYGSYLLYFDFKFFFFSASINHQILFWTAVEIMLLRSIGVHKLIWRYIGFREIQSFLAFSLATFFLMLTAEIVFGDVSLFNLPFALCSNNAITAFGGLVSVRIFRRWLFEYRDNHKNITVSRQKVGARKKTLLIGAGSLGFKAVNAILSLGDRSEYDIVGFLDDSADKRRRFMSGTCVLGALSDLKSIILTQKIEQTIITINEPDGELIKYVYKICEELDVKTSIMPSYKNFLSGKLAYRQIREIQVEDLLGRKPVKLNDCVIANFVANKTICITGAGGSIGSELVRQVLKCNPSRVLLLERSEPALYQIHSEICRSFIANVEIIPIVSDICDIEHIETIFLTHNPAVVLHAAAHKHVPMMEENIYAALKNNTLGTQIVAEAAGKSGVENFVLISTDKAVRPTSIMGMSKQLAEKCIIALNSKYSTNYSAVRFGNVLGSSGSVIPLFKAQIKNGGPVTVTSDKMIRYFMTMPESCQLVLQAAAMGEGGELFVLDMGEPVKIIELAKDMIRMSGFVPNHDIAIDITGIRPGEKLYEELHADLSELNKTKHPLIFQTNLICDSTFLENGLNELISLAKEDNGQQTRQKLKTFLQTQKTIQSRAFSLQQKGIVA